MTVLRHPIERVISSYRMIRNTYLNEDDWTIKSWLLHKPMPPIQKHYLSTSRHLWINKTHQRPHSLVNLKKKGNNQNSYRSYIPTLSPSSKPTNQPTIQPTSYPTTKPTSPRFLPTYGLDENYMTKWLCGLWYQNNIPFATQECYERAIENINKFHFVFITQYLSIDLPNVAKELGLNLTEEELNNVIPYNIRMHDPILEDVHNISYSANISNLSSIPEFSENDGSYELAIKKNHYDLKLYRHALYRNCITLKKNTIQNCQKMISSMKLI